VSRRRDKPILIVAPEPFYEARGTPINVLLMCKVLTSRGYPVDLATYPIGEDPEVPGLGIHRCLRVPGIRTVPPGFSKRKVILDFFLLLKVLGLLIRRRYAVVHAVEEAIFLALPLTWLGIPVVYDLDSVISEQLRDAGVIRHPWVVRAVRRLERLALERCRAAITMCSSITATAKRMAPDTPVFQVEDTPLEEAARFPDADAVKGLREELGLDGRPVVVYTGNLEPYQGIDLLLDAAAELRKKHPHAAVVLVGGDGPRLAHTRRRIESEGLRDTVLAVGKRPVGEMPEWMALADVLASPRIQGENTPLKIYTYMRSGRPIVATRLPTHTQVLDHETAVLCDPSAAAFAAGMRRVLERRDEARRLANAATRRVEDEYSPEAFRRKLLGAYDAILDGAA
jgi:glycosyltransferase involved in cell wall biosynthesis